MRHLFAWGRLAAALLAFVLVSCGGGGGAGRGGEVPPGGGSQAPADGGVLVDTGTTVPGAPPPVPPTPPQGASAPVAVTCVHTGSGREINIDPSQPPVTAGSVQSYQTIGAFDWNSLGPGDTVRIHWSASPYREKILISTSGTDSQPIRVCGVPGPGGELPYLSGENATTRTTLDFGINPDENYSLEHRGVIVIWRRHWGQHAAHIRVEGLKVADTLHGLGREQDVNSYTATNGQAYPYDSGAACIWVQKARDVQIRGNVITNCGNGVFTLSRADEGFGTVVRDLVLEGNYIHNNGLSDSDQKHQTYLQGINFTVQFNYFGPPRTPVAGGMTGNDLKMRTAGDVIRYNYFENGARTIDLVEVEDFIEMVAPWRYARWRADPINAGFVNAASDAAAAAAWAAYQRTYFYGNILNVWGTRSPGNVVHYSFDNSQHDRRPGKLYFYNNSISIRTDGNVPGTVQRNLFDQAPWWGDAGFYNIPVGSTNAGGELHYIAGGTDWGPMLQNTQSAYASIEAVNNAIHLGTITQGAPRSAFGWTRYKADQVNLGRNWISSGWDAVVNAAGNNASPGFGRSEADWTYPGGNAAHHVTGAGNLLSGAALPFDLNTYAPASGSPLLGQGAALPAAIPPEHVPTQQIQVDVAGAPGRLWASARTGLTTLGAIESAGGIGNGGGGGGGTPPAAWSTVAPGGAGAALYGCDTGTDTGDGFNVFRYVRPGAAPGGAGTRASPYGSLQAAYASITGSMKAVLCVEQGALVENVGAAADALSRHYKLVGGFLAGSNFTQRSVALGTATRIQAASATGIPLTLGNHGHITVDGFELTGGARGLYVWGYSAGRVLVVRNNHVHGNGAVITQAGDVPPGYDLNSLGGMVISGSDVTVEYNDVYDNQGGHNGAGIHIGQAAGAEQNTFAGGTLTVGSSLARVRYNRIHGNVLRADTPHGAGLALNINAVVERNLVWNNQALKWSGAPGGAGVGGGMIAQLPYATVDVRSNWFEGNRATKAGAAIFLDEATFGTVSNNVVANNDGFGAIFVDGRGAGDAASDRSFATIVHNTVVLNTGPALGVQDSVVRAYNNLMWHNGGARDIDSMTGGAQPESVTADRNVMRGNVAGVPGWVVTNMVDLEAQVPVTSSALQAFGSLSVATADLKPAAGAGVPASLSAAVTPAFSYPGAMTTAPATDVMGVARPTGSAWSGAYQP